MDHWGNISALNVQFLHNKRLDLLKSKHKFQQIFRQIACRIFMHLSLSLLSLMMSPRGIWPFFWLEIFWSHRHFSHDRKDANSTTRINKIFELLSCAWVWILAAYLNYQIKNKIFENFRKTLPLNPFEINMNKFYI